jgi:hypothetical protein
MGFSAQAVGFTASFCPPPSIDTSDWGCLNTVVFSYTNGACILGGACHPCAVFQTSVM